VTPSWCRNPAAKSEEGKVGLKSLKNWMVMVKKNILLAAALVGVCMAAQVGAFAQASNPFPNQPQVPANADDTDPNYPQVGDSNPLGYVNANANSVLLTDHQQAPFNASIELRGSYTPNVFASSQNTMADGYFAGAAPVGYRFENADTRFSANYRIDGYIYPGYPEVNSISQVYTHRLQHRSSEETSYSWDVATGRTSSVGQYLPAVIAVGGTGVVQPTVGQNVAQNSYTTSNIVTDIGIVHRFTEVDRITATATGGWIEQHEIVAAAGVPAEILRSEPVGVDIQYDHRITAKSSLGAEVTDLYLRGLAPVGHENYAVTEATFKRKFSPYLAAEVAAGPLFSRQTSAQTGAASTTGYAANAGFDYDTTFARVTVNYSRVIQLQYQAAPVIANQVFGVFDRPISRDFDLTLVGRYIHSGSAVGEPAQDNLSLTGRLGYYLTSRLQLFVSGARFQLVSAPLPTRPLSYNQNVFSGGIDFLFGPPLERQGQPKQ
jgi:hypothetical protein